MNSDDESLKQFLKDNKLESKKPKKEEREDDDSMLIHDLLRLSVADPDTRDDDKKILKRLRDMRK